MKKISKGSVPILLLLAVTLLFACKGKDQKHEAHTMPHVSPSSSGKVNDSLATLVKPTDAFVLSAIETVTASTGLRSAETNVQGVIDYNTNTLSSVSSRISGRIERLYVKYNYQAVSKGQKLMDIYSPDLANAQQEMLFLRDNNEPGLLESAKKKLRLLGSTEQQINRVIKTGKVNYSISIYSPSSGYISENRIASSSSGMGSGAGSTQITSASSSSSMGGSMGTAAGPSPSSVPDVASNTPLVLREGQYVTVGQQLFNLANSNSVWAEFYISPDQLDEFKKGSSVSITSVDVKSKRADVPVSLIQPYYSEGVNYSLVRAILPNSEQLWKVGELIHVAHADKTRKKGTWLPRTSVLQLGTKYVAFVKEKGAFVPVYVSVKSLAGEWVDIGNSIPNREVALNAWFLVDSESFIKVQDIKEQ